MKNKIHGIRKEKGISTIFNITISVVLSLLQLQTNKKKKEKEKTKNIFHEYFSK